MSIPGIRASSKHWANYLYRPMGSLKEQRASAAENLFFEWLIGGSAMNASSLDSLDIEHLRRMRRSSKAWANFSELANTEYGGFTKPTPYKTAMASKAEDLFFEWLRGAPL